MHVLVDIWAIRCQRLKLVFIGKYCLPVGIQADIVLQEFIRVSNGRIREAGHLGTEIDDIKLGNQNRNHGRGHQAFCLL